MAVFLIFSDDWGRHPSSCQHLTRCLMNEGKHRVFWVNTIGTRPPGFNWLTVRRAAEKIKSWFIADSVKSFFSKNTKQFLSANQNQEKKTPQNHDSCQPKIIQPIMFPWFRTNFDRWLNRKLLTRSLNRALANETDVIAVTTLPIVADLLPDQKRKGAIRAVTQWIYYCVDDWSRWPGMDAKPLAEMELKLLQNVDKIVAAGENLRDRIHSYGREAVLLTHGVDLKFWGLESVAEKLSDFSAGKQNDSEKSPFHSTSESFSQNFIPKKTVEKNKNAFTRNLPRPIFLFWGLLDERLDLEFLEQLAEDIPNATILMAGPSASSEVVARLEKIHGLKCLGNIPYEKLPLLASEADVLLMPYLKNESTEQIQPLKMTEYLASGKPAVVRDLRAAQIWKDALDIAETPIAFSKLARLRAETGLPESQRTARNRLKKESWEQKAAYFETFILENKPR
ncbi:MAG: glycosyltransferase family 1 protein [Planctomycetaceae bacterium]|nr:glycosyltransferase family 1 protein [Planctomycetaceae bacterium]